MIEATHSRLIGLVTIDFGELKDAGVIRHEMTERDPSVSVSAVRRNARYFDVEYSRPLIQIQTRESTTIRGVSIDALEAPADDPRRAYTEKLIGAAFREVLVLSQSGIGCIFYLVDIGAKLDTDQIIFLSNILMSRRTKLGLGDGTIFDTPGRIQAYRDLLKPFVEVARTDYVRYYSMIHLVSLSGETLKRASDSEMSIYDCYENEFHALGVRVIQQWRERYPEGSSYPTEPNVSLSPVGVLKFNLRNALFFEYPYDEVEVEDLYYIAMIEVRIWDLMVTAQIQFLQARLTQYENREYEEVSPDFTRHLQRSALRTSNEFYGYYLSTSKRARNFYHHAYVTFDIPQLLTLMQDKGEQLGAIIERIQRVSAEARQRELVGQQRDLLEHSNEAVDRQEVVNRVLNLIGLVTGVSLALQLDQAFNLGKRWQAPLVIIFGACYLLVYFGSKAARRVHTMQVKQDMRVEGANSVDIMLTKLTSGARRRSVQDIVSADRRASWVTRGSWPFRDVTRFEMAFQLAGPSTEGQALLSVEMNIKLWRWRNRERALRRYEKTVHRVMRLLEMRVISEDMVPSVITRYQS